MIYIGTSGWSYPHWHDNAFYPNTVTQNQELGFYAGKLNSVELNASFYHLPKAETFTEWKKKTPEDFLFAIKASRYITHKLNLKNADEAVDNLLKNAKKLGPKLGPVLFQLSPRFRINFERLKIFLETLPEKQRFAFEFRHKTWFDPKVYGLLRSFNCALVFADTPDYPLVFERTTDFVYVRLHGHEELYKSNYTEKQIEKWAGRVRSWRNDGNDVYVYFDNDANAYAPNNALQLKSVL